MNVHNSIIAQIGCFLTFYTNKSLPLKWSFMCSVLKVHCYQLLVGPMSINWEMDKVCDLHSMAYSSAIKLVHYGCMLQQGWASKPFHSVKEARQKAYIEPFHLYETSRKGKTADTESKWLTGWSSWWERGWAVNRHEGLSGVTEMT